ncbi:MAG TPA: hypothetical protein VG474_05065 [Solirubrobacteraceae bacterium]|nr:hypothetical protein [Solirubrobacteraceae bacterium]
MADAALFVGFGPPARAREQQALDLFNQALALYSELQSRGEIESFEPVLLEPHGGDLGGFILIRGSADQLHQLRRSGDFRRITARAGLVVESFGVVDAYLGEGLSAQLAIYEEQMREQLAAS